MKYREGAFLEASWVAVYLGQRIFPQGHDMRADLARPEALADGMDKLKGEVAETVRGMPDHLGMIARYCPMAA